MGVGRGWGYQGSAPISRGRSGQVLQQGRAGWLSRQNPHQRQEERGTRVWRALSPTLCGKLHSRLIHTLSFRSDCTSDEKTQSILLSRPSRPRRAEAERRFRWAGVHPRGSRATKRSLFGWQLMYRRDPISPGRHCRTAPGGGVCSGDTCSSLNNLETSHSYTGLET